jgi:hypothetical protein
MTPLDIPSSVLVGVLDPIAGAAHRARPADLSVERAGYHAGMISPIVLEAKRLAADLPPGRGKMAPLYIEFTQR